MAMNLVVLTGRLTKDPELKYGASGTAYCRFTIAVGRAFQKDQPTCTVDDIKRNREKKTRTDKNRWYEISFEVRFHTICFFHCNNPP